ncbi:nucleoside recognition domain-containing protein [Clostridium sp. BJN0001]|uniref:spore maturation protein n=1 Tax=Clostridium sp. BJN0001 TaxID=2930219 RepID=UPI001FD330D9|nr:nucleoside recognition domain-containing protein [Clostridium sp. BJN0001]
MFNYLSKSIIPIIFIAIITYGMFKGAKVYDWFIEGAKEGLKVCLAIFPYLLAMLIAVRIFKEASLLEKVNSFMAPLCKLINIPSEVVPLILIKPLSGSGAMGVFTDIIKTFGADGRVGLIASIIMGTTETIFYTISIYYGSVKVKKIRHTLWAALCADLTAIIMAGIVISLFILK